MSTVTTKEGIEIYYKDWGQGQSIVFHHGWPLSADDWDTQMLFFVQQRLPGDRHRSPRPRAFKPGVRWPRHGPLRRRRGCGRRASGSPGCDPYRPFHRRRRGDPLRRAPRQGPGRKGGAVSAVPPIMVKSRATRADYRSRCSTAAARASPLIGPSFTATSPPAPSTDSIGRVPHRWRVSSGIGGDKV